MIITNWSSSFILILTSIVFFGFSSCSVPCKNCSRSSLEQVSVDGGSSFERTSYDAAIEYCGEELEMIESISGVEQQDTQIIDGKTITTKTVTNYSCD